MKKISKELAVEIETLTLLLEKEKHFLKKIEDAKERLKAILLGGYEVEGWRLVKSYKNRRWQGWVDEKILYEKFKKYVGKKENLFEPKKLKSPARIEKYFIEEDQMVKVMNSDFVLREESGYRLERDG